MRPSFLVSLSGGNLPAVGPIRSGLVIVVHTGQSPSNFGRRLDQTLDFLVCLLYRLAEFPVIAPHAEYGFGDYPDLCRMFIDFFEFVFDAHQAPYGCLDPSDLFAARKDDSARARQARDDATDDVGYGVRIQASRARLLSSHDTRCCRSD